MILILFPLSWAVWLAVAQQHYWPLGWLLALSLLTFIAYGWDKHQAIRTGWRIPESQLHLLSLLAGWPGAMLAQHYFRHKTQKRPFRLIFWLTVSLHCIALLLWLSRPLWWPQL